MKKNIQIQYNGELGYAATIEDVVLNVFKIYSINPEEFLDYSGVLDTGDLLSNRERVFKSYSIGEKVKYGLADDLGNVTKTYKDINCKMRCPYIVFSIDASYVTKNIILNNSNLLTDDFSESFIFTDEVKKTDGEEPNPEFFLQNGTVFKDNLFFETKIVGIPNINKNNPTTVISGKKTTRRQYVNPRVWIWCKALNENGEFNNNSIFDLSPFVETLDMSSTEGGGQFSINLLNIEGFINVCEGNMAEGVWNPRKDRYVKFKQGNKINYLFKNFLNARFNSKGYDIKEDTDRGSYTIDDVNKRAERLKVDKSKMNNKKDSISSDLFFKNLISENDIVFITFRDDEDNEIETVNDFFIGNDKLPGRSWEMIGLVDRNSVSITYEGTMHDVNISGRDCMKLLIEDGSYFFANSYSDDDVKGIFQNIDLPNRGDKVNTSNQYADKKQSAANRLAPTGMVEMLFIPEARNVKFVMNLLISTLSNIEICHSRLFEYYDNRTKFQIPRFETVKQE